ncbi:MAG TPA: choice-of-anchor J domain-containing protein, partial [Bacteroidales bacterium]|nr:choice-of-anchor J domain-containing protein [Bacteroidales bacterium]
MALAGEVLFQENFESGWGDYWGADNGLWEIGVPTAGPEGACTGKQCAGTILDGNYGAHTDSRLITPTLYLPETGPAEEIHFRFMNWFSFSSHDSGHVQISVFDETSSTWSDWEPLVPDITHTSSSWSMMDADLTLYACQRVKIAFNHTAARDRYNHGSESTGWYIDDVRLVLPERFMEPTPEAGPPDIYEPDDIKDQAGIFDMSSTIKRVHSFHKQGNQDWIKLYCSKNQVYTFNITKTGPRVNMVFNIYDGISDSLLKRFYVPTECEKSFSWKCPEDGLYYVATAQANPDIYGEGTQYSLRVYPSFTVEPETLELSESSSATITIRGGKGPYKVASSDETVVSAQLFTHAGVFAKVEAFSAGTATITISDSSINGEAGQ